METTPRYNTALLQEVHEKASAFPFIGPPVEFFSIPPTLFIQDALPATELSVPNLSTKFLPFSIQPSAPDTGFLKKIKSKLRNWIASEVQRQVAPLTEEINIQLTILTSRLNALSAGISKSISDLSTHTFQNETTLTRDIDRLKNKSSENIYWISNTLYHEQEALYTALATLQQQIDLLPKHESNPNFDQEGR